MEQKKKTPKALHPHLEHQRYQEPCDHCNYFKGIAFQHLAKRDITEAPPGKEKAEPTPLDIPRSLESIAREEEKVEQAHQAQYLLWCKAEKAKALIVTNSMKNALYECDTESTTLREILNSMNKDQLLDWLERKNNDRDDMAFLCHQSSYQLRDYIQTTRRLRCAIPLRKKRACDEENGDAAQKKVKKEEGILKPPRNITNWSQLTAWYERAKAPELKAEFRRRGLRPTLTRKADLVEALVRDDLKN